MKAWMHRICAKKHIIRLLLACMVVTGMTAFTSVRVLAGDINGEEARVIAAASGTFYYDNEAYRAKSEYISQLSSYLARDDINLTAAQADTAIAEMYSSIAQGVSEGYLYKVGGDEDTTESTEEETTESGTTEATTETEKPPIMIIPDPTTETTEAQSADGDTTTEVQESSAAAEATTESPADAIEQIEEEDADGNIRYDVENHTIIYEDKEGGEEKELPSIRNPLDVTTYVHIGIGICIGMLAVILLLTAGLVLGKCFPWQKKRRKRKPSRYYMDHKARAAYRKVCGNVFTVLLACHAAAAVLLIGAGASVFRKSFVIDNLTSSGYYRYIYDDMTQTIRRELADQDEDAVDSLMHAIGYDMFLSAAKQQALDSLDGHETVYDGADLQEKLTDVDCGLSQEEQQTCVNVIVGNLQTSTTDLVGSSIYGVKQGYRDFIRHTACIMMADVVLMAVVAILMDRYRHRGVRYMARGVIAGGGLALLAALTMYIWKPYTRIHMEPASLYLFMRDYLQHAFVIAAAIACIAILIGALLMVLVGVIRKRQTED